MEENNIISREEKENLINNKYFRSVLLSYYSLTRDKHILECLDDFKNKKLVENLFDELPRYLAGYSISLDEYTSDPTMILPHVPTLKGSLQNLLKKK